MSVDPARCILYFPAYRSSEKRAFLEALGATVGACTTDPAKIAKTPDDMFPIIGCYREIRDLIYEWDRTGRPYLYRDNGYFRRANARWSKKGAGLGHYRWHWNRSQLGAIGDFPSDRFDALRVPLSSWRTGGNEVVVAVPTESYSEYHGIGDWTGNTLRILRKHSRRPVRVREKSSGIPLKDDLAHAHCLVTHGSIAAVEAVTYGCPVFVDPMSAAASVGRTDLTKIEKPVTPRRRAWLAALAYSQFSEREMLDGTLWPLLPDPPCRAC